MRYVNLQNDLLEIVEQPLQFFILLSYSLFICQPQEKLMRIYISQNYSILDLYGIINLS